MRVVARTTGSSPSIPALELVAQDTDGFLQDVAVATFTVRAEDGATVGGGALPGGITRLSPGRYAASWQPPAPATAGRYTIEWEYGVFAGGPLTRFEEELELVEKAYPPGPVYSALYDLRAEGFTVAELPDVRAQRLIVLASRYVERFTGRSFVHTFKTLRLDGQDRRAVLLGEPIVAIEGVLFRSPVLGPDHPVPRSALRIYNRHLTHDLRSPDDRDSPRLEGVLFPEGCQNIEIRGVFGYTEPDGTPTGRTPDLIRQVARLLVARNMPLVSDRDALEDAQNRGRILEETTKEQKVVFDKDHRRGPFAGDPEIDQMLLAFMRPPAFAAA